MRRILLAALVALFFVLLWKAVDEARHAPSRGHPWTSADDPFDPDALRDRMERLAPLVSAAVGERVDPAWVRIRALDDRLAAERAFERQFPELLDTRRDGFRQEAVDSARARFLSWSSRLGSYDSESKVIEIHPVHFDTIVPGSIDALLDLVVAHELAHAWQDQRHGLLDDPEVEDLEARLARRAVIEGSAEFVARRVAQARGTESAFDRLARNKERAVDAARAMGGAPIVESWFYTEGLAFVSAVRDAGEGDGAWRRLFGRLPRTLAAIERPQEWLATRESPGDPPDGAVNRLLDELEGPTFDAYSPKDWKHLPIPVAAVADRLALAGVASDHEAWRGYQRGVSLSGQPDTGAFAKAGASLRVWRLETGKDALAARASLEEAAQRRGARSWARREYVKYFGPVRPRSGRGGTTAYAQAGVDRASGEFEEDACAFGNRGPWLFEATTECVGAAPALLELVDLAIRAWDSDFAPSPAHAGTERDPWDFPAGSSFAARDRLIADALAEPGGENELLAWLRGRPDQPAALLAALRPSRDEKAWRACERGATLVAALRSEDPDVRRFALRRLDEHDCEPGPLAGEVPGLVRDASGSPNPEIRALAVAAACKLELESVLAGERLRGLLADPAAPVRAALARGWEELGEEARRQLRGDEDPIVRAAAEASRSDSIWRFAGGMERIARQAGAPPDALLAYSELDSLFVLDWDELTEARRRSCMARLRRHLASRDKEIRMLAIQIAARVDGDRSRLVPDLLDAFDSGPHRRAAAEILRSTDFDLAPHTSRLSRMLANPFTRVDALRVMAAHGLQLSEATRSRIRVWTSSGESALACAAALVVEDDLAIQRNWRQVQLEFRCQVLDTVLRSRPESPLAAHLREVALVSPYANERKAVYDALESARYSASHWEALLTRIGARGSEIAGECWADLADRIGALDETDAADAVAIVTRHLQAWCDRDRLPDLSWYERAPYSWEFEDWPSDPAFLAALDRCILRADAPGTRLIFALTRIANTGMALPPPVAADVRALFAASPIEGVPVTQEVHEVAVRCEFVPPDLLVDLIRRSVDAEARGRRRFRYVSEWVGEGPGRDRAARALVPELLERGTGPHVKAALHILSNLGTASADDLEMLRALRDRAMPEWRERFERCIDRLE